MMINRVMTRTYSIVQAIELREGELDNLLKRCKVDSIDQISEEDWEDIWLDLEDEDEFTDRVFNPMESILPWGDYQDEVEGYMYREGTKEDIL
jgi:hypothetical protein